MNFHTKLSLYWQPHRVSRPKSPASVTQQRAHALVVPIIHHLRAGVHRTVLHQHHVTIRRLHQSWRSPLGHRSGGVVEPLYWFVKIQSSVGEGVTHGVIHQNPAPVARLRPFLRVVCLAGLRSLRPAPSYGGLVQTGDCRKLVGIDLDAGVGWGEPCQPNLTQEHRARGAGVPTIGSTDLEMSQKPHLRGCLHGGPGGVWAPSDVAPGLKMKHRLGSCAAAA
mmetsp:Transcript_18882/g.42074  ORF Transcript_18882/g.42074 Transcript_18882/m.42074 type:complete len:222 (-) Transcript_18882:352-1017(-)